MFGFSIKIAGTAVITALSLNAAPPREAEPVAVLMSVTGNVRVARAPDGAFKQATSGLQLFEGDRISTREESELTIHLSSRNQVILGAKSSMTISVGREMSSAESDSEQSVDPAALSNLTSLVFHRAGRGEIALLGGYRAAASDRWIEPVAPRNTLTKAQRPIFSWLSGAEFERFEVKLFDDTGQIWKAATTDTELIYEKEGLLTEAIAAFGKVAELHPEAPLPQEILAVLYAEIGLDREAIKAKERAERLKEGN